MQLLPMASSPDGLISARYAVITKGGGGGTRRQNAQSLMGPSNLPTSPQKIGPHPHPSCHGYLGGQSDRETRRRTLDMLSPARPDTHGMPRRQQDVPHNSNGASG